MEKLNRALCELGYSFSTVIVIVVEMFVIVVKMGRVASCDREGEINAASYH